VLDPGGALMIGPSESLPPGAPQAFAAFPGVSAGCGIFIRRSH
jgi:hypothetical protein